MALTSNQRTAATFLGAMVVTCLVAATYLLTTGIDDDSISLALRVSARVSFALFIIAFAARPLQQLVRAPWTARLLRNRRLIGVAFAGVHTAHFGLVLMRLNHVPEFDSAFSVSGAAVYGFMYAMLITSFSGPARAIGPRAWKVLHKLGIFVVLAGFLPSQLLKTIDQPVSINGLLLVMASAALLLRVMAFFRNRRPRPQ